MDRFKINCLLDNNEVQLQFDKKAMPGEAVPCYMITADGSFRGYVACQKNGALKPIGTLYYAAHELGIIEEQLARHLINSKG